MKPFFENQFLINELQKILDGWCQVKGKPSLVAFNTASLWQSSNGNRMAFRADMSRFGLSDYSIELVVNFLTNHFEPSPKIKNKYEKLMTVQQLIERLQTFPPDTVVGNNGHFGEYLEIYDVNMEQAYITENNSWRDENRYHFPVVTISLEDAGPDPE